MRVWSTEYEGMLYTVRRLWNNMIGPFQVPGVYEKLLLDR